MDSEPVELPLDYLQGHKDGLEWAAQLAKANHPETGDWLYDDPIELAKAISKGPDMPPSQPAMDSEPVAEVSEDYAIRYISSGPAPKEGLHPGDKLYRHAQPVVPDFETVLKNLDYDVRCNIHESEHVYQASKATYGACRAAMLQTGNCRENANSSTNNCREIPETSTNAPVISDGSASMLRRWLAFGRGMQNAGSQLPRSLIAETESMLAASPQEVKGE
ncbi:DUF551 domain-containing protein [Klebsiella michiganensis]|uniref:DUF551 domain-containing protein n=1 Tax=Klebsiella michiganensis TaxID=1134687 RepID=UPI003CFE8513